MPGVFPEAVIRKRYACKLIESFFCAAVNNRIRSRAYLDTKAVRGNVPQWYMPSVSERSLP